MARTETIQVNLDISAAQRAAGTLRQEAANLRQEFANINVGFNAQAFQQMAQAQMQNANAARANAQAQQAQANAAAAALRVQQQAANVANAQARAQTAQINAQTAAVRNQTQQVQLQIQQNRLAQQGQQIQARQEAVLRRLGQEYGNVNANMATNLQAMTQWIQSQDGMANAAVRATGIVQQGGQAYQTYVASVNAAGGGVHNFRYAVNTADGAVRQLDQGVRTGAQGMAALSTAARSAISMLRQIVGFYGIGTSLRKAFTEMKSMSDEMIVYQKVTKSTAQEMETVRAAAYDTAIKYGQTPTDFLAAASEMARAGYKENSTAMADLAVKTKLVGDITAEEASKFLLAVDAGYKYQGNVEQLAAVLDSANEIGNNFATSVGKISEGMTLIASLGAQAGVPIEQLIAALGTMTATTQRSGSEMARGLRSIFLNVLKDTSTEIEEGVTVTEDQVNSLTTALQHYAPEVVKAANATGKLINPMEAIGALAKAYKEGLFDERELFTMSKKIAGQRYYNAFAALIENYDGMYQDMLQTARNATGSADAEIDVLTQSWTTKLNQLSTTWTKMVNDTVSENFIKGLIDAGKGALEFAGNLENVALYAVSARGAIQALSSGIRGIASHQGFGGFNALTLGISTAIALFTTLKNVGESAFRSAEQGAKQAAQANADLVKNADSLSNVIKEYQRLSADGVIDNSELSEARSLQEQLKTLVGETASEYDLMNGSIAETTAALREMYSAQLKSQLETAQGNTKNAGVYALNAANNWLDSITGAGLRYDTLWDLRTNEAIRNYIESELAGYYSLTQNSGGGYGYRIGMKDNMSIDELVSFYKKSQELQKLFIQDYSVDDLAKLNFYNDLADGLKKMQGPMDAYLSALESEHGLEARVLLDKEKFSDMTFKNTDALNAYIDSLVESNNLNNDQAKALRDVAVAMAEIERSTAGSNDPFKEVASSAEVLANAIDAATNAKKAFDDAMKTKKSDAFSGYMEAYETYKKEMEEGRVNSTAMYAAAQLMMGQEKWEEVDKTSQGVRDAFTKVAEGAVGSLEDAFKVMSREYKDANGNVIQGAGIYELVRQSGIFKPSELVDENGNYYIPKMTEEHIQKLSEAFSGLDKNFIIAALKALAESDIEGTENDEDIIEGQEKQAESAEETAQANQEAAASAQEVTDANQEEAASVADVTASADDVTEANQKVASAAENVTDSIQKVAENSQELSESLESVSENAEGAAEPLEEPEQAAMPDISESTSKVQEYNDALKETKELADSLNETKISVQADTEGLAATKDAIGEIAKGPYDAEIGVDANKGDLASAQNAIANVAGAKYTATIHVKTEGGELQAAAEAIAKAAEGGTPSQQGDSLDNEEEISLAAHDFYGNGGATRDSSMADLGDYGDDSQQDTTPSTPRRTPAHPKHTPSGTAREDQMDTRPQGDSGSSSTNGGSQTEKGFSLFKDRYKLMDQLFGTHVSDDLPVIWQSDLAWGDSTGGQSKPQEVEVKPYIPEQSAAEFKAQAEGAFEDGTKEGINKGVEKSDLGKGQTASQRAFAKVDEFERALDENNGDIAKSLEEVGTTWQDLQGAYTKLGETISMYKEPAIQNATNAGQFVEAVKEKYGLDEDTTVTVDFEGDTEGAENELDKFLNEANSKKAQIALGAATGQAKGEIDSFIRSQNGRKITLQVETENAGGSGGGLGRGGETVMLNAGGTRNSPGGLSMVNDGSGPEIVVQRGHAFIPGGGRPTLINLDRGAKVFTASETRSILSGSGVPAFADGTAGITFKPWSDKPASGDGKTGKDDNSYTGSNDESNNKGDKQKGKGENSEDEDKKDVWSEMSQMVDYIINKIGKSIDKQIDELEQEREAAKQQNELADKQEAVAKAQADLNDAMNERTVRYLGEDGKWHWMADARNVKKAQESLDDAKKALQEYEDDMAFNDKIKALRAEYDKLANAWQEIKDAVATPTGTLQSLISAVLSQGTPQERTGANAVSNYLLSQLIPGTNVEGDYNAALTAIARATAGNPIMPNEDLATIIANAGATGMGNVGGGLSSGRKAGFTADQILALQKQGYTPQMIKEKLMNDNSSVTNYNYSINGVKIGADEANTQPLSKTMKKLSVYSNSMVS